MSEEKKTKEIITVGQPKRDEYTLTAGHIWLYFVDGLNRYIGNVKLHLSPDCTYLANHKPGRGEGDYLLRDSYPEDILSDSIICKSCLKRNRSVES